MNALAVLHALIAAGVDIRVEDDRLKMRGPSLDPGLLRQAEACKAELLPLLDGSRCKECGQPIEWRGTDAVAFADGTSLHGSCRAAWWSTKHG